MNISPYMNINRIEFIVTYHCTGRCIHCSLGDKLNDSDGHKSVKIEHAANVIRKLAEVFPVSSVMTFGGEPLLYPDVVCAIHQTAESCGIELRQLITNGYFTKNKQRIREVAEAIKDAGVSELLISVDAFHQQTIPVKYVESFARHVSQLGIPNISLHPAWLVNQDHDNPYNQKTKEILAELSDCKIPVSSGNDIFLAGNAAKYLSEYYPPRKLSLSGSCGSMPYTEPLDRITSLSIVPNGDVMVCGFAIGNLYQDDIAEIVSRYNPYDDLYMNAILSGGASGLLAAAESNGLAVNGSGCYSICDLCHTINRQR